VVQSALLLVDKPAGFTSHDVVAKCRKILGTRKIGHAGTLDPMATGLLVLGVEAGTKLLTFIVGDDKTYEATIRLGQSTITDDCEGEILTTAATESLRAITDEQISEVLKKFLGKIQQVPSSVSAIKVAGERAYDLVRAGEEVNLKAREVEVQKFEIVGEIRRETEFIDFDVIVDCSSGTYIRALARDVGNQLGIGGHLTSLRRTRIGKFSVAEAQSLDAIVTEPKLLELVEAASSTMETRLVSEEQEVKLRHGKRFEFELNGTTALVRDNNLVAIVEPFEGDKLKSLVVFPEVLNG